MESFNWMHIIGKHCSHYLVTHNTRCGLVLGRLLRSYIPRSHCPVLHGGLEIKLVMIMSAQSIATMVHIALLNSVV